ncbi:MAG: SIR2 family protein [Bacteroidales bacterium]|nr:SIR2 family protein [Bacteroidales bacterium]
MQQKVTPIERLIRRVRRNKVTLFIGSGFSIKAGAPSVYELICRLMKDGDLNYDCDPKDLCLRDVASDFVEKEGRHELMRSLFKHFSFTPTDTSDHKLLASIPHFKTIFTTNYDSLIENAYPNGQRAVLTSSQGCSNSDCAAVNVYKLHGDLTTLSNTDSIIITNEDYDDYFHKASLKALWEDLKYSFRHSYVVFIGYSLADDNIFDIIKTVRDELDGNVKGMYLISPYIHDARKQQLESNGITYIKLTGEQFLTRLKQSIDDTIVNDFTESRLEDNNVFYQYLKQRGLNPTIQFGDKTNIIDKIAGYNGATVSPELNLKITPEAAEAINKRIFNTSQCIPGTKFILPAYQIDVSSLIEGELRYNGILFGSKSDWKNLLVMPPYQLFDWTIKIPSINFLERTKVCIYHDEKDTVVFKVDIKIGEISITLKFDNNQPIGKVNIETDFYDSYESSSKALQWIDVPIALLNGDLVNFQFFKIEEECFDKSAINVFKRAKLYYQTIKQLELENDVHFSEYNNYSKDGLVCALILKSYLNKHGIAYPLIRTFKCELESSLSNKEVEELVHKRSPQVMVFSYVNFKGKLNGYEFHIPYVNICLQKSVVKAYNLIEGNRYTLEMEEIADENLIYGSDVPTNQVGNIFHLH